jgi:hypothetical protein
MNLVALRYDLQLCREHGTYVDLETLAFAIHHVLQGDTEMDNSKNIIRSSMVLVANRANNPRAYSAAYAC